MVFVLLILLLHVFLHILNVSYNFTQCLQEKIKQRDISYEANSKILTSKYLQDIENIYKLDFLKDIETHSHVLIYDWINEGDVSTMVEDIEMLNFDYDKHDDKMADWNFSTVEELRVKRLLLQDRDELHKDYFRFDFSVPELHFTAEESEEIDKIMEMVCTWNATENNLQIMYNNIIWLYIIV